jgi:hypothetical protein
VQVRQSATGEYKAFPHKSADSILEDFRVGKVVDFLPFTFWKFEINLNMFGSSILLSLPRVFLQDSVWRSEKNNELPGVSTFFLYASFMYPHVFLF